MRDEPPPLVFISASSQDYEAADGVYCHLVRQGVPVFFSHRSLPELGNSDYRRVIDAELDRCTHMVVVTSSRARVESPWVEAEWGFFINAKRSGTKTGNIVTVAVGGLAPRELPPSLRFYEVIPYGPETLPMLLKYVAPRAPAPGSAPAPEALPAPPGPAPAERLPSPGPPSARALASLDLGPGPVIKIFGIGNGGRAVIDLVFDQPSPAVVRVAIGTDQQALQVCHADVRLLIGSGEPRGLGAALDPARAEAAAELEVERIRQELAPCDLAILSAGLGGGTGTGVTPVVARVAQDLGILTVCLVSLPFRFEGPKRGRLARAALDRLCETCDLVIPVPGERALAGLAPGAPLTEAYRHVSAVVARWARALSDLFLNRGLVNIDFADLRAMFAGAGMAAVGQGEARGTDRVEAAIRQAMTSGLLSDVRLAEARSVVLLVEGGPDLDLAALAHASELVSTALGEDADLVFGHQMDAALGDAIRATIIATRFPGGIVPGLDPDPTA